MWKRKEMRKKIQEIDREKETEQRRNLALGRAFHRFNLPFLLHLVYIVLALSCTLVLLVLQHVCTEGGVEVQRKESCKCIEPLSHSGTLPLFLLFLSSSLISFFPFFLIYQLDSFWFSVLFYSLFSRKDETSLRFSN